MQIRYSCREDIPAILEIYDRARRFMAENGNPNQWRDAGPRLSDIEEDIASQTGYICEDEGRIAAVFMFGPGPDPIYEETKDIWLNDEPYYVVHRIASSGIKKGTGLFCLSWCISQYENIRIDTHKDNIPMRSLIEKVGFKYCGPTRAYDGTARMAYHKIP